jgi:hypothetical protein
MISRVVGVALLFAGIVRPAVAQRVDAQIVYSRTSVIPDSMVVGVVYDVTNGTVLSGSAILASKVYGNVSDASGRFSFALPAIHDSVISFTVAHLGYEREEFMVRAPGAGGLTLSVGLAPGHYMRCPGGDPVLNPQGIRVYVHDIITGLRPNASLSITVKDSVKSVEMLQQPYRAGYVEASGGGPLLAGPRTVTVSAPGYIAWIKSGFPRDECDRTIGSPLHIWITPNR